MKRRLVIREKAQPDLVEAARWYDGQREGLGDELLDAIRLRLTEVVDHPFSFQVEVKGVSLATA